MPLTTIIAHLFLLPKHKFMNRVGKWCVDVYKCSANKVYNNVLYLPEEHWGGGDYLTPWNVPLYKEVTCKVLTSSVVALSPRQHPTSTRLNGQLSPFDV